MKEKNRILLCVPNLESVGGVASYYNALRLGLSDSIEYYYRSPLADGSSRALMSLKMIRIFVGFKYRLANRDVSLVCLNSSLGPGGMRRDRILLFLARRHNVKLVWFIRGWDESYEKKIDRIKDHPFRKMLDYCDAIIVLSARFSEKFRSWGFKNPIFVETTTVAEEVSQNLMNSRKHLTTREIPRVLFLARLEREKGIFPLLDAIRILHENVMFEVTIAGDGGARSAAETYARELKLRNVRFLGYVSGERKAEAFASSDIYVFPSSHGEGMPNSVLEAMACGLVVISTPVGGICDFFEDGRMGFLIDRVTPGVIAERLKVLLEDRELCSRVGEYNIEYARRFFEARVVAKRLEGVLDGVLRGNARSGETYRWCDKSHGLGLFAQKK